MPGRLIRQAFVLLSCVALAACNWATGSAPSQSAAAAKSSMAAQLSATPSDGLPQFATRFPEAPQSLRLSGAISAQIASARPSSCGFGSGPDNVTLFEFAGYMQAGSRWYFLTLDTDKTSRPYRGPGTYSARANLRPTDASEPQYSGMVLLTVSSDSSPDGGKVSGTITSGGGSSLTLTGGWTCSPGGELGPA
jgi:hypothetical protein